MIAISTTPSFVITQSVGNRSLIQLRTRRQQKGTGGHGGVVDNGVILNRCTAGRDLSEMQAKRQIQILEGRRCRQG